MRLTVIAILATMASSPALAEPLVINTGMALTDMQGQPILDPTSVREPAKDCSNCKPLTLGRAIAVALCTDTPDTAKMAAIDKARACALGMAIIDAPKVTLDADQVTTIEGRVGNWSPQVVLQVIRAIDPGRSLGK